MDKKIRLQDEELENVAGGQITYTWNGESGTIGIGGNNNLVLLDKEAFIAYYKSVEGTKKDSQILTDLFNQGIIAKP